MKKLLRGIVQFRKSRRADYIEKFARLALGQKPDALLIACSDSRVVPNIFASVEPGDLLVIRNIGNLVPSADATLLGPDRSVSAALEFGLGALAIRDVIVCGHSECGAIREIHEGRTLTEAPNLRAWLDHGRSARGGLPPTPPGLSDVNHLSQRSVLRQIENLRSYRKVREAEAAKRLALHAWWFDVAHAEVLDYEPAADRFVPLDEARVEDHLRRMG